MSSERAQKKTERSHEENKERAYIAASRRADRSIEARVQSARMASEIHKKRTGKGFKISEEIVMKEEMYEEEDDDLPRHYRALAAHLHTSSPDMNTRLSAYLTGQVAMASMARQKEVDKLFAESFPNAARMGQQMAQSVYFQGLQQASAPSAVSSPSSPSPVAGFHGQQQPAMFPEQHSQARPALLSQPGSGSYAHSPQSQHRPSVDSPPVLSPASVSAQTESSHSTPHFTPAQQYQSYVAPQSLSGGGGGGGDYQPFQSSFTSELPNDARLLANIAPNDPLAAAFYGMPDFMMPTSDGMDFGEPQQQHQQQQQFLTSVPDDISIPKQLASYNCGPAQPQQMPPPTDYFDAGVQQQHHNNNHSHHAKFLDPSHQGSRIGTPGGGEGDAWESWIDEAEWALDADQRWVKAEQC